MLYCCNGQCSRFNFQYIFIQFFFKPKILPLVCVLRRDFNPSLSLRRSCKPSWNYQLGIYASQRCKSVKDRQSEVHRSNDLQVKMIKGSKVKRFKDAKIQRFTRFKEPNSKMQRCKSSQVQRFQGFHRSFKNEPFACINDSKHSICVHQ